MHVGEEPLFHSIQAICGNLGVGSIIFASGTAADKQNNDNFTVDENNYESIGLRVGAVNRQE
jgi:hypothetical protein